LRQSRKWSWLRIAGTLIALGLLVYLISQQSWKQIWLAIQQIPPWRLVLSLILMLVSRLAVSMRWFSLLRATESKITLSQSIRITLAGLFASNFLPTTVGGDVVRLAGAVQLRLDAAIAAASLIADRLVGIAGMTMMVPFSLPALSTILQPPLSIGSIKRISIASAPAEPLLRRIGKRFSRFVQKLYESMKLWLHNPSSLLKALLYTWIHMLCLFTILHLLLGGIGEYMPIWMIGGLYSLVYFLTLIPISVNGYGVQEISMVLIFSNLGKASLAGGLTVAILFRTIMMVASLPGAFFLPDILSSTSAGGNDLGTDQSF
jgi:uncharacterized membrane protein YbhN (UPF0104 family)